MANLENRVKSLQKYFTAVKRTGNSMLTKEKTIEDMIADVEKQASASPAEFAGRIEALRMFVQGMFGLYSGIHRDFSQLVLHLTKIVRAHDQLLFTALHRDAFNNFSVEVSRLVCVSQKPRETRVFKATTKAVTDEEKQSEQRQNFEFDKVIKNEHVRKLQAEKKQQNDNKQQPADQLPFTKLWYACAKELGGVTETEYGHLLKFNIDANAIAHQPATKEEGRAAMTQLGLPTSLATLERLLPHSSRADWIKALKKLYAGKIAADHLKSVADAVTAAAKKQKKFQNK